MSKLKSVFNKGPSVDEEIDSAFSAKRGSAQQSFSERVLQSQQKFSNQFQGSSRPAEPIPASAAKSTDFGRFDPDFAPDTHLDPTFDETKNIEDFRRAEAPSAGRGNLQPEQRGDLRELATATPRRDYGQTEQSAALTQQRRGAATMAGGDAGRVIEELEDIKAQNSEILRRIQRIEEKLRKAAQA